MSALVEPLSVTYSTSIDHICYYVQSMDLSKKEIVFFVTYLDVNDVIITMPELPSMVTISGEEYNLWGQDDGYIIQLLFKKLNLTPRTPT